MTVQRGWLWSIELSAEMPPGKARLYRLRELFGMFC